MQYTRSAPFAAQSTLGAHSERTPGNGHACCVLFLYGTEQGTSVFVIQIPIRTEKRFKTICVSIVVDGDIRSEMIRANKFTGKLAKGLTRVTCRPTL